MAVWNEVGSLRGPKGDTGATPDISVSATVGTGSGTPTVQVTEGGTAANPTFALAFDGLVGDPGPGLAAGGADGYVAVKASADDYDTEWVSPAALRTAMGAATASSVTAEQQARQQADSQLQTAINGKQATITGAATTIASANLAASRALVSDGSGKVAVSAVTSTELGYLDGVTGAIQTQLNGKAASTHTHAAGDITSGTLAAARIPSLDASKIASGTLAAARIPALDASKITSGTISIDRLPQAALERLVVVDDDTARFDLTTSDVQLGDVVKVESTGLMYYVKDTAELDSAAGYEAFTAGSASSVPWSGVTGKPSTFTPSTHTHPYAGSASAGGPANSVANSLTISLNGTSQGAYNGSAAKSINVTAASVGAAAASHSHAAATTSATGFMSAADKQKLDGIATGANNYTHPSYTAHGAGLYKVTVDATGHVSAATAVSKSDITALGIPASDTNTWIAFKGSTSSTAGTAGYVPAPAAGSANRYFRCDGTWAVPPDTNTTYTNMGGASSSAAGRAGLVPAPSAGQQTRFLRGDGTWAVPTDTNTTYSAGTGISLSGTTFSLSSSGVTAGSYGPTANVTGTNGTIINVPQITVDAYGRVTGVTNRVYTSRDTDTNTTYSVMGGSTSDASGSSGLVPAPAAGAATRYLRCDGTWQVPPDTNTTYTLGSFGVTATAAELNKLDGVTTTAAQLNYLNTLTGNVQTQLNGKAASSHNHDGRYNHVTCGSGTDSRPSSAVAGDLYIDLSTGTVYRWS